jgi:hypothetical protein
MIKIIAVAPYDGWAFIEKGKKVFLLEPPYESSNMSEASENVVENAVGKYGFEECDITFGSMKEVIRYIKDQFIKSRKDLGIEAPSSEELRDLLKYFEDDVLLEYLRRAREELIPQGKFDAAEAIALDILKLERVKDNPEMHKNAIDVLESCQKRRNGLEKLKDEVSNSEMEKWNKTFPRAMGKYTLSSIARYCRSIQRRGQLLPRLGG